MPTIPHVYLDMQRASCSNLVKQGGSFKKKNTLQQIANPSSQHDRSLAIASRPPRGMPLRTNGSNGTIRRVNHASHRPSEPEIATTISWYTLL
ncbi:hypothetical protein Pdw03_4262 [Penicillium digitatum]|uniref:Uncharacterized protein n=1 Tax=Penicillium digitatum TaxID=36651 RepID=A0A7T6XHS6_PENDI|nr:hypothetical protein Pdw03_4262 [Penicillium digitatum]